MRRKYLTDIINFEMAILKRIILVIAAALAYYLIFDLNKLFFGIYEFSYGVNWIFIPSGIQLLLVLVAGIDGALGIFLGSLFIGLENYYLYSVLLTSITALISGGSPLVARKICFDFLDVDKDLRNINLKSIVQMSLIFGLISASLHQLWFFYNSKSDDFLTDLIVMFTGNIFGTLLVLVFATFINMIVLKNIPKRIDDE